MKFSRQVLCCYLLYCLIVTTRSSRQANLCYTPDNYIGVCVLLTHCPSLLQLHAANGGSQQISRQIVDYLRGSRLNCDYRVFRSIPVVCCDYNIYQRPKFYEQQNIYNEFFAIPTPQNIWPNNSFLTILTQQNSSSEYNTLPAIIPNAQTLSPPSPTKKVDQRSNSCQGPDARAGICQSLINCPELANRLQSNRNDQSFVQFLRQSNQACRQIAPIVCCPIKSNDNGIDVKIPSLVEKVAAGQIKLMTPEEGCGQTGVSHKKIVGGNPAILGSWPWIALLGYAVGEEANILYNCGGSLITKRHVVTASHCIMGNLRSVRLGEHDLSTKTETAHIDVDVVRAAPHPSYNKDDGNSDIAILYLGRDVKFTDKIRPICVPNKSDYEKRSLIGYTPFVAGWGQTLEGGNKAEILQELQIPIQSNNECMKRFKERHLLFSERQFNEAVICAGVLTGGKDACGGDSGGPLMLPEKSRITKQFYYNIIGIVSYGDGCARKGIPGVYASVPNFSDWIRQKVAEAI